MFYYMFYPYDLEARIFKIFRNIFLNHHQTTDLMIYNPLKDQTCWVNCHFDRIRLQLIDCKWAVGNKLDVFNEKVYGPDVTGLENTNMQLLERRDVDEMYVGEIFC